MNLKEFVKRTIGLERFNYIKGCKVLLFSKNESKEKKLIKKDLVQGINVYSEKGYDTFCGYYDYFPLSKDESKILCQRVKKGAKSSKNNSQIGYYFKEDGKFVFLTETQAWNWQQGSRLHWSTKDDNLVYYNDIENGKYCTRVFDINEKKVIRNIIPALYDINYDETIGISVNFSRLHRLRPGYGYSKLDDETKMLKAPSEDGLIKVDLASGEKTILVSLAELAKSVDPNLENEHYLNHISFSPNGNKVMFFHLWTDSRWPGWMTRLCVYNLLDKELKVLEETDLVSHYNWMDDNSLLITGANKNDRKAFYRVYNTESKVIKEFDSEYLNEDGHPTYDSKGDFFVSDTYPDKDFRQRLFIWDGVKKERKELLDLFSDPRRNGEFRCDLHPKYKNNYILLDSTFQNCTRSILLVKV